jgi:ribosomal protein L11 methylase PrmA
MTGPIADPASFRDPAGRVYRSGERILRTVSPEIAADFEQLRASGLIDDLVERGWLISSDAADRAELDAFSAALGDGVHAVIEHPRLPLISYPYEWGFAQLKAAALLHLDVHLAALGRNMTLCDASAYNVQFLGAQPLFIDLLSFRPYREGQFWEGYRQFCEQFLNPLLLHAYCGVPHNAWFRGRIAGIPSAELSRLIPLRRRFSKRVLTHVVLHAALTKSVHKPKSELTADAKQAGLPKPRLIGMLTGLRSWIDGLAPAGSTATYWDDYSQFKTYSDDETLAKHDFVRRFVTDVQPGMLWDLGCNTGDFSMTALDAGAGYVVGWDNDLGALDIAFARSREAGTRFTPLYGDACDPTPAQGWAEQERAGWQGRGAVDAVLALALIHHLAITNNVPLGAVVSWLVDLAPCGVVEFVGKEDSQVQGMLGLRDDIFPDYTLESFLGLLGGRAKIVERLSLSPGGRELVWYDARDTSAA